MSEEEVTQYLERLSARRQELIANPKEAQAVFEAAGICDRDGNLTKQYK